MQALSNQVQTGAARMTQFESNQLRLGMTLQQTERALNATINQVNQHSQTLEIHNNRLGKTRTTALEPSTACRVQ